MLNIKKIVIALSLMIVLIGLNIAQASEVTGDLGVGGQSGLVTGLDGTIISSPITSPVAGDYHSTQAVSLTATSSSSICYTTDGTTPACATATTCLTGTKYSSAISITSSATIKAISCYANSNYSSVSSNAYTLTCSTTSVSNGSVSEYPSCSISCNTGYTLSNNSCVSSGGGGGGGGSSSGDSTPPQISDIKVTTSANQATIAWKTNESSITSIEYGTTTLYGLKASTNDYKTTHELKIENLTEKTTYHFKILSKDILGNSSFYTDQSFATLGQGELPKLVTGTTTITTTTSSITSQQQLLNSLIAQLQLLLQQASQLGIQIPSGAQQYMQGFTSFTKDLYIGIVDNEVKELQKFLNKNNFVISQTGPGSLGNETNLFGILTQRALIKFQKQNNISPAVGYFGTITRKLVNSLLVK